MENKFWSEWAKFVAMLLGIVIIWVLIIFVADKVFNKSFEQLKYLHYFIFFAMLAKAKNIFLKRIKNRDDEEDKKN